MEGQSRKVDGKYSYTPYKIGLISCSKKKLRHLAPAGDLYCSDLAQKSLRHATTTCDQVMFVSGHHGLLSPDTMIECYDEDRPIQIHYYGGAKKVTFINVLSGGIGQRLKWLKEAIKCPE